MKVTVVTTLHKDGYNLYGKNNIDTWINFFPQDWEIHYYAEKHFPDFSNRIKIFDFNKECPEWDQFYDHIKSISAGLKGKELNWYKKALRWSFKMFALVQTLETVKEGYVIWLDADNVALSSPPSNWVKKVLNNKAIAAHLEQIKHGKHIESGVLVIDTQHPDVLMIKNWIRKGYIDKLILNEPKAWDSFWLAKLLLSNTVAWNEIKMVVINSNINSGYWLNHKAGTTKFKESGISGRSGRTEDEELLKEE